VYLGGDDGLYAVVVGILAPVSLAPELDTAALVGARLAHRGEIGIRRALGATRLTVGAIFLIQATALCVLGAVTGALAGVASTAAYTTASGDLLVLPPFPLAAALGGALLVGLVAGLYPALRAVRLTPTDARRTGSVAKAYVVRVQS